MRTKNILLIVIFLSTNVSIFSQKQGVVYPIELTTEYLVDPTGLNVRQPQFSWKLAAANSQAFSLAQTAYRILVNSTKQDLDNNKGNIWDTGWNSSDEMQLIDFINSKLTSYKSCYWKVQIKNEQNRVSKLNETTQWNTGLFSQNERTSNWIRTSEEYKPEEGSNKIKDPWFRKTFTLNEKHVKANLFVVSVGYHEVFVNGKKSDNMF